MIELITNFDSMNNYIVIDYLKTEHLQAEVICIADSKIFIRKYKATKLRANFP